MFLELLFITLLIIGLCVMAYRGAVHEFQILQKDYLPTMNWSEILDEQLPIVIRGAPRTWIGHWTQARTEQKTWNVEVVNDEQKGRTTWNAYLKLPVPQPQPENKDELARVAKLSTEEWAYDNFRRWSWLPAGSAKPQPNILCETIGAQQARAEFTALVATDGSPLEIWLAHEGAVPANVAGPLRGKDPWIQTTASIPWISEVKFIEIKLRPGNILVIPKHWWYALRPANNVSKSQIKDGAWHWSAEFHTPISLMASYVGKK
jgi:hypothetical protein